MKILIVGGVAGGASAAARLRRLNEEAEIILFERGAYISYANCGLPYYLGGVISERERLFVQTPEGMRERYNIDVRVENEVIDIDRQNKVVQVKEKKTGNIYQESYDKLLLSPGAEPIKPNIPGINQKNVYFLRTVYDTDQLKKAIEKDPQGRAVVVGGGFIGVETAENLRHAGLNVTLVEAMPQIFNNLDQDMVVGLQDHLRANGVRLFLNDGVKEINTNDDDSLSVVLQSSTTIKANLVVLAVGVRPETKLAVAAGLEIGETKAIAVNEYLQTSDSDIYAVGDAVEVIRRVDNKKACIPLAGPANRQGRIVADNILGQKIPYQGALGTAIAKVFAMAGGSTGLNEKQALQLGIPYRVSITHSASHASYYPGAYGLTIKLVYTPQGDLLGGQVVGFDGVDKRLDVIASCLKFGGTVMDLADLELAYAPPFGSAKDPVNIAGYVASNIVKGDSEVIKSEDIETHQKDKALIIDVREPFEYALGFIRGAINIPLDQLRKKITSLPQDREIIIYCRVGLRGYLAERILKLNGFPKVKNITGGYVTYQALEKEKNNHIAPTDFTEPREIKSETEAQHLNEETKSKTVKLDACGLQCPGPISKTFKAMEELAVGDILEIEATDPGFLNDIAAWSRTTGNTLLEKGQEGAKIYARLQKAVPPITQADKVVNDKTIVVFSSDLDKAIATLIIANGASSMGRRVTLFFTFWGLNILRKAQYVPVKKTLVERMFGFMMPRGTKKLGLSRLNMAGMGPRFMRKVMEKKNIDSLESLLIQARLNGVRFVACQMSMDVMGIKPDELLDGVEIGGVASYLEAAESANVNLFI